MHERKSNPYSEPSTSPHIQHPTLPKIIITFATRVTTVAFAALVTLASTARADFYANFFDDGSCTQNGGQGVDLRNTGCLSEAGRSSVYIPNTGLGTTGDNQWCLVITSGDSTCTCQNVGFDFTALGSARR
ncbi:hypothetical protein CONPUDRAFT_151683 [Coniophora puteana RWD-64-598 SS2]|uniref:Uncharacterized protein n=1 Tax=Coniophora puteana (strain RWD-64-598) TaxID=741705 RepID=A0A5M3MU81_CONPW|nr:uncharacterized protein CONPUDRAFT_151683 [Coniophora puteana RWD-64-598 SS2]EIW82610.1 hypothetical protein CONPUDRAFT_151683 [Coniophora puteana RWD-64-598 SS2]